MTGKTTSKKLEAWRGRFGDAYAERNAASESRLQAYTRAFATIWRLLDGDPPASVLECGCNVGLALRALGRITGAELSAVEPNGRARALAVAGGAAPRDRIVDGCAQDLPFPDQRFDLVFTSGVLIHVAPADLPGAFDEIARVSRKYVLFIEYFSREPAGLDYRGQQDMLWKLDYGRAFMQRHPAWTPIDAGFFWHPTTGFDDSNWWLFRRGA
jgi:pseudaminic acid biosynthesis-associated methylase